MSERPNRIRYFRRLADLSQEDLGRAIGVTKQSISDWERGKCWPSFRRATALAQALGCSLDGLFVPSSSGSRPDATAPAPRPVAAPVPSVRPVRRGGAALPPAPRTQPHAHREVKP